MSESEVQACSKCGVEQPLDKTYYPFDKRRSAWAKECRLCLRERGKQWRREHPTYLKEYKGVYKEKYPERLAESRRRYNANRPKPIRVPKARTPRPRKPIEYYRQKAREYEASHKEARKEKNKRWRAANPEKVKQFQARDAEANKLRHQKRRARQKSLPDTFTAQEWRFALEYFNHSCAVCGRQLRDLFGTHTAAMDHWIPLSDPQCPGTMATNIVPLCHGQQSCNTQKYRQKPEVFLIARLGKKAALKKQAEIERYFQSLEEKTA